MTQNQFEQSCSILTGEQKTKEKKEERQSGGKNSGQGLENDAANFPCIGVHAFMIEKGGNEGHRRSWRGTGEKREGRPEIVGKKSGEARI